MSNRKAMTVLAVSILASNSVFSDEVIQSVSHGTYELPLLFGPGSPPPGSGQVGELVTCEDVVAPPFQRLIRTTWIFDKFEGVCDDLSSTPCNGRLVAIQEACTADDDPNTGESGLITALYLSGSKMRICWDESSEGRCTQEYEVATGEGIGGQTQALAGAQTVQQVWAIRTFKGSQFVVDGKKVKIEESTSISHRLNEVSGNFGEENFCIAPLPARQRSACGASSISVRTGPGNGKNDD